MKFGKDILLYRATPKDGEPDHRYFVEQYGVRIGFHYLENALAHISYKKMAHTQTEYLSTVLSEIFNGLFKGGRRD